MILQLVKHYIVLGRLGILLLIFGFRDYDFVWFDFDVIAETDHLVSTVR